MSDLKFSGKPVLAVDIGGTKVAVAVVTVDGVLLACRQEPTCQTGPDDGIRQLIRLLEETRREAGLGAGEIAGIGIGIPAVLETGTDFVIWGPNLKDWKNVGMRKALEDHFHLPVAVEYDGHTAVLGEWWQGAGRSFRSIVSIIIGTGVGGGMVLEGNLIRGVNRLAGAVGWFVLEHDPAEETEQERSLGNWEARIAGPGIARRAQILLEQEPGTASLLRVAGRQPTAKDVFELAQQGDRLACRVVDEEVQLLGMGIANIVSMANPELIVLGGSVGSHAGFLIPRILEVVKRYAQPISGQSVQIVASTLGTEAGLLGAACGMMLRLERA